jgi:hypothetical protein
MIEGSTFFNLLANTFAMILNKTSHKLIGRNSLTAPAGEILGIRAI